MAAAISESASSSAETALAPERLAKLREIFSSMDVNADGTVTRDEYSRATSNATMLKLFDHIDKQRNGSFSIDQWLAIMSKIGKSKTDEQFEQQIGSMFKLGKATAPEEPALEQASAAAEDATTEKTTAEHAPGDKAVAENATVETAADEMAAAEEGTAAQAAIKPAAAEKATAEDMVADEVPRKEETLPSDAEIAAWIVTSLHGRDLSTVTPNGIRAELEKHFHLNAGALDIRWECIKDMLRKEVTRIASVQAQASSGDQPDDLPSDANLAAQIAVALQGRDLASVSYRVVRAELESHFGLQAESLERRRNQVQELLRAEVTRITAAGDEEEDEDEGNGGEAGEDAEVSTPAKKRRRRRFGHRQKKKMRSREDKDESSDGVVIGTAEKGLGMPREEFMKSTEYVIVRIGDTKVNVPIKEFSSGSIGFHTTAKIQLPLGGGPLARRPLDVMCQISCALMGSKEWS